MDDRLKEIVETVINNRMQTTGKRYYGGAVARIIAQVPKGITDKDVLVDELEKAFTREESCYF